MSVTYLKTVERWNYKNGYISEKYTIPAGTEKYQGLVLRTYNASVQVMSDMWEYCDHMEVYNHERMIMETHMYDSNEVSVIVDASPEVVELAGMVTKIRELGKSFYQQERKYDVIQEEINRGSFVEVIKGRNVPKGTKGQVFWIGQDNYNNVKVGIATSARKDSSGKNIDVQWTAINNCRKLSRYELPS